MWYRVWCLIVILGATLAAVVIPFQLVMGRLTALVLYVSEVVVTIIFCADLLIHLFHRQAQRRQFRSQPQSPWYRQGWFILDLVTAIPWPLVIAFPPLLLIQLLKLIRVAYLMRQQRQTEIRYGYILRLARLLFWISLLSHGLACGWLALDGPSPFANQVPTYLQALYWCITTLTTVGYGDVTPATSAQMIYTMAVMILGVGMYGYVIGNVASMLANIDAAKTHYLSTLERLAAFMRYRNIPTPLQRQVYDYYTYLWENRMGYDESAILSQLPPSLQTEISLVLKREFIAKVPFLQDASQELMRDLALQLRPDVFTPGNYIFKAGEIGRHMYFISRGTVEIIAADQTTIYNTLHDGEFFGEIALLYSQPRTAGARATEYCDIYRLNKDTFQRVLAQYPEFATHMQMMARQRQNNLETQPE